MQKKILLGVAGLSFVTAVYMEFATQHWYDRLPGAVPTGPLNFHFALDVTLAYLMSGVALLWADLKDDKSAGICGAGWLVQHAVLHIWI